MNLYEAKQILKNARYLVESKDEDRIKTKSHVANNFIHAISDVIDKYFSGKKSTNLKYDEIEIMRQVMISVSEYAQILCELNGTPCQLETLKRLIRSEYNMQLDLDEAKEILERNRYHLIQSDRQMTSSEWYSIAWRWKEKIAEQEDLLKEHPLWPGTPAELKTKNLIKKYKGYYDQALKKAQELE